ncbi:hypothetical protein pEaSNUABM5_00213 [Erwinia phage pEa_SNUABM_5]|uniref:Uncharacterized protein n=1 Tax=Erwinia phage pEa_SNUABM_5 TaxID=2797313 RepID=A0A7T8EPM3_9CAUD|nr:hypothetical protein MPK73_gp213 [Erwinia phage pEa_SNUABM_5]QQO90355.1 hypothetical protein pEaSNUABM5_00213 [Erwinia phage pEa_SNUABM_5]
MTTFAWLVVLVIVAALMFVFGVWWTKRHPNESQRYFADFEKTRLDLETAVKQQTDKLSTVVDGLDNRLTSVEQSASSVAGVAQEMHNLVQDIKLGLERLGAKTDQIPEPQIVVDPLAKK